MTRATFLLAIAAVLGLLVVACSSADPTSTASTTATRTPEPTPSPTTTPTPEPTPSPTTTPTPERTLSPTATRTPEPTPSPTAAGGPANATRRPLTPLLNIPYGGDPNQVGDLRLPEGQGLAPVVVLIHGGFWQEPFKRDLMTGLASDLTLRGFATWNLEYRRVGASGGGWPLTAIDVAMGIDHLEALAPEYSLDLDRVALVGHSAGGHLALWAAARHKFATDAPGARPRVTPTYVVSLAGVADLEEADRFSLGGGAVASFLGRDLDRSRIYPEASPRALLPLGVAQLLVHGTEDRIVPSTQSERFASAASKAGDEVELTLVPGADHFQLIDPSSSVWIATAERITRRLLPPDE